MRPAATATGCTTPRSNELIRPVKPTRTSFEDWRRRTTRSLGCLLKFSRHQVWTAVFVTALGHQGTIAAAEDDPPAKSSNVSAVEEDESGEHSSCRRICPAGFIEQTLSPLFDRIPSANIDASWKGGIDINRDQGDFAMHIGGRLFLDAARYFENKNDLGDPLDLRDALI